MEKRGKNALAAKKDDTAAVETNDGIAGGAISNPFPSNRLDIQSEMCALYRYTLAIEQKRRKTHFTYCG